MTLDTYLEHINRTWRYHPFDREDTTVYQASLDNAEKGVIGELGEIIELLKKSKHHGIPYTAEKMNKELGDFLYYAVKFVDLLRNSYTIDDILQMNVEKLQARYPEGFVEGGGIR